MRSFCGLVLSALLCALHSCGLHAQYVPTVGVFSFQVSGPSALVGTVFYQPDEFTPGLNFPQGLTARAVLPNSVDGLLGCAPLKSNFTTDGVPIQGTVLLLKRGTCPFYNKVVNVQAAQPALVIVFDSVTATLSTLRLYYDGIYIQGGPGVPSPSVPGIGITAHDGNLLSAALTPNAPPVYITINGTGPLQSGDRAVLVDLLNHVNFTAQTPTQLAADLYAGNRPWTMYELNRTDVDPCLVPLAGLVCLNGRVASLRWLGIIPVGVIPASFGQLSRLAMWQTETSGLTDLGGTALCQLSNLQVFELTISPRVTALPDCFNASSSILRRFEVIGSSISHFPASLAALPSLQWVSFSQSQLASVPTALLNGTGLVYLDLSQNAISQQYVSLRNNTQLVYVDLSFNAFTGVVQATDFDLMPGLLKLSLANNALSGEVPMFNGSAALQYLDISNNAFSGGLNTTWSALQALSEFHAPYNRLTAPVGVISTLPALSIVDLSHNALVNTYYYAGVSVPDVVAFVSFDIANAAIKSINLGYNALTGGMATAKGLANFPLMATLLLNNNQLSGTVPSDLFPLGISTLDVSSNNFSGALPATAPGSSSRVINLAGNPLLTSATLPSWLTLSSSQMVSAVGVNYLCPSVTSSVAGLQVTLDATAFGYHGCQCKAGMYSAPAAPYCVVIPVEETVTVAGASLVASNDSELSGDWASTTAFSQTQFALPTQPYALTDGWYGSQRLMQGLATSWKLLPNSSTTRSMLVYLHLDPAHFNTLTDIVTVSALPAGEPSSVVLAVTGLDAQIAFGLVSPPAAVSAPSYLAQFNASLSMMGSPLSVLEVQVLTPSALISFTSYHTSGMHMLATWQESDECPQGIDQATGGVYEWDNSSTQCSILYPLFTMDSAVPDLITAMSAINLALALAFAVLILVLRSRSGVKGSSVFFSLLVIAQLALLAAGALFYATVGTSDFVCSARVWWTCLPLTGVLASLMGKTRRIQSIFGMKKLIVKRVTNKDILLWVVLALLAQIGLLVIFTSVQLSQAQVVVQSGSDGLLYRFQQCSQADGFVPFILVEVVVLGLAGGVTALLAFLTRHVAADFNESWYIALSMGSLLILAAVFVPMGFLITSIPEATTVIQGCGQNLIVLLMLVTLYASKLYYILGKKAQVQQAETSHTSGPTTVVATLTAKTPEPAANRKESSSTALRGYGRSSPVLQSAYGNGAVPQPAASVVANHRKSHLISSAAVAPAPEPERPTDSPSTQGKGKGHWLGGATVAERASVDAQLIDNKAPRAAPEGSSSGDDKVRWLRSSESRSSVGDSAERAD